MKFSRLQFNLVRIFVIVWLTLGVIFTGMFYRGSLSSADYVFNMAWLSISGIIILAVILFYKFRK
jgi:hypothetical protein